MGKPHTLREGKGAAAALKKKEQNARNALIGMWTE